MSDAGKAVFLSYASQDAEAAKRICDALRAADVEVWFDQSELRGGDAWDQKIRRQIKECALFVPVITPNTNARPEGYFRLEWKLAVDRSHLLADDHPFLFPVVVGDVTDATARVPEKFREVQWTRLRLDETPAQLAARVARLLGGAQSGEPESGPVSNPSAKRREKAGGFKWWWLLFSIMGMAVPLVVMLKRPARARPEPPAVSTPAQPAAATLSEARKLANQAMLLLEDANSTRESSWLAEELCERALKLDAGDAEIWAAAAFASINLYWNTYDTSAARREKLRSQAARASQLDPKSVRAALAVTRSLDLNYEKEDSLRTMRELHRRAPEDQHVIFHLTRAEGAQGNEEAVRDLLRQLRALPRTGMLPLTLWFETLRLRSEGRFAEAEALLAEMFAAPEQLRGAYYEKLQVMLGSWHDLAEAESFIASIPARYCQEPSFGSAIAQYWLWRRQPEKALQVLAQVPQDYFEEYIAREPKGLLAGWAHSLAGRPTAAQAEWRQALALVDERLKTDNRNFTLLYQRALLLALTGQSNAARDAWQLRVELGGEQERPSFFGQAQVYLALNEPELAITCIVTEWPKLHPGLQAWVLPMLRLHPAMAPIQHDPRLQRIFAEGAALLQRMKLEQTGASKSTAPATSPAAPPEKADDKSVAVLAFANLSDDKANEYFSDGISEELLNVLAKVPGLTVRGRSSGFFFKGAQIRSAEIGRQLDVSYLVQGSVRRAGDRVRISAQLIRAATDEVLWSSGAMDRDLKDIFAVQDEIARLIAQNLELKLSDGRTKAKIVNPEAHRLVLEGRYFLALRGEANFARSDAAFRAAVAIAPDMAEAHAGWAELVAQRGRYQQMAGLAAPGSQLGEVERHAARALQLDPSLSEPHAALAVALVDAGRLTEADVEMERGIAANPNYGSHYLWRAHLHAARGRLEAAINDLQRATELDPLAFVHLYIRGAYLGYAGRWAEALPLLDRGASLRGERFLPLEIDRALARLMTGRRDEAMALARSILADPDLVTLGWWSTGEALWILRQGGADDEAERHGAAILAKLAPDNYLRGYVLCGLGRFEEGLPLLRDIPTIARNRFYFVPLFDPARETPAFKRLISEMKMEKEYALARADYTRLTQEAKR